MNIANSTLTAIFLSWSLLAAPTLSHAQEPQTNLEARALQVLKESCVNCHGEGNEKHGDIDFITDPEQLISRKLVDPENPEKSRLLDRMRNNDDPMPPDDAPAEIPRPDQNDIQLIQRWISSLKDKPSKPHEDASELVPQGPGVQHPAIKHFLESQPNGTATHWRFFSFENLRRLQLRPAKKVRNPNFQQVSLDSHRAALAKAVNSLSWASDMARIESVGEDNVILAVDFSTLRDVNAKAWSLNDYWALIESKYPYGIEPDDRDFKVIKQLTGTQIPILRADWFVATALRPPLYDSLLGIPPNESTLHQILGVTPQQNIINGLASRVGFTQSGVSKNANRLIERHPARYGYFWVSYDFLQGKARGNLFQFPTGPEFPGNPHPELAFQHDGGEIIFSLPNGLQGYMLVNDEGRRLTKGPAELVSDDKKVSGSPEIVNGISCIACHRHGIYPYPNDQIGSQAGVAGEVLEFVKRLHDTDRIERRTKLDKERFLYALDKATGPWFRSSAEDKRSVTSFPEPITILASEYTNSALGLAEVAAELGVTELKLSVAIQANPRLQRLGLVPLTNDDVIKREFWQGTPPGQSPFQQTASQLGLGIPSTKLLPRQGK